MNNDKVINCIGYVINILSNNKNISKYFMINDKTKTINFLKSRNFPTTERIEKKSEISNEYIVAKPNNGKCGKGIHFFKPGKKIPDKYVQDDNYIFEKYVLGTNYRIVLYKNSIITVFERIKPTVIGNGKESIKELIKTINNTRSPKNLIILDSNIDDTCIPSLNEKIQCNNLCNYSTGGTVKNIDLKSIPLNTQKIFVKLSKNIDLTIFSIDLIASDITQILHTQQTFCINELEYCNDWDVHYIMKDKFYVLSKYLILYWVLNIIIIITIIKRNNTNLLLIYIAMLILYMY